jgi:hypothetical protein
VKSPNGLIAVVKTKPVNIIRPQVAQSPLLGFVGRWFDIFQAAFIFPHFPERLRPDPEAVVPAKLDQNFLTAALAYPGAPPAHSFIGVFPVQFITDAPVAVRPPPMLPGFMFPIP